MKKLLTLNQLGTEQKPYFCVLIDTLGIEGEWRTLDFSTTMIYSHKTCCLLRILKNLIIFQIYSLHLSANAQNISIVRFPRKFWKIDLSRCCGTKRFFRIKYNFWARNISVEFSDWKIKISYGKIMSIKLSTECNFHRLCFFLTKYCVSCILLQIS